MKTEEIKELFMQGIDCSQVVAEYYAEEIHMDRESLLKMSACFGGGMQCGETCGAVTGALMVIGLKYGHARKGEFGQKQVMLQKVQEFKSLFGEKYPSCICKELLGYNIADPDDMQKILDKGLLFNFCPKVVRDTIQVLEKIM